MAIYSEKNLHPNARPIKYKIKENGCWECVSHRVTGGYPTLKRDGKTFPVHRYIYINEKGLKNRENYVLHNCDNKLCINPNHLHEGTHSQNLKEAWERNLYPEQNQKGSNNYNSKLKKDECLKIYYRYKNKREKMINLAKEFNCSRSTINKIVLCMHWSTKNMKPIRALK